MNTLVDIPRSASYTDGYIVVAMDSGVEFRFPVTGNPRLEKSTPVQLNIIEISPFGLHWSNLDEDLSIRGIAEGNYGQPQRRQLVSV